MNPDCNDKKCDCLSNLQNENSCMPVNWSPHYRRFQCGWCNKALREVVVKGELSRRILALDASDRLDLESYCGHLKHEEDACARQEIAGAIEELLLPENPSPTSHPSITDQQNLLTRRERQLDRESVMEINNT